MSATAGSHGDIIEMRPLTQTVSDVGDEVRALEQAFKKRCRYR